MRTPNRKKMRLAVLGGTLLAASAIGIGSASASTFDWWPTSDSNSVVNKPAQRKPPAPARPSAPPSPAATADTAVTVTGSTGTIEYPWVATSPSGSQSTTITIHP